MKLYLVRHGETIGNVNGYHQTADTPLSADGIKQAQTLAQRFRHIPVDVVFASDMERAAETARIINTVVQKELIYTPYLREIKRPTEIEGLTHQNKVAIELKKKLIAQWEDPNWHHSDEDNFYDMRARCQAFFTLIEERKEKNILAATHGFIMRMLLGTLILGEDLTPRLFLAFLNRFEVTNTGITLCERRTDGWRLVTWNDHAHLG